MFLYYSNDFKKFGVLHDCFSSKESKIVCGRYYVMTPLFVLQRNEKKSQPEMVVAVYQHTSRSNRN